MGVGVLRSTSYEIVLIFFLVCDESYPRLSSKLQSLSWNRCAPNYLAGVVSFLVEKLSLDIL